MEGEADVWLIYHNDFYRCLVFWTVQRKPGLQMNCPNEVGAALRQDCTPQGPLGDPRMDAAVLRPHSTLMGCASRPPLRG